MKCVPGKTNGCKSNFACRSVQRCAQMHVTEEYEQTCGVCTNGCRSEPTARADESQHTRRASIRQQENAVRHELEQPRGNLWQVAQVFFLFCFQHLRPMVSICTHLFTPTHSCKPCYFCGLLAAALLIHHFFFARHTLHFGTSSR